MVIMRAKADMYISVYVSLMCGEFDNQLHWSFLGNVTIHFRGELYYTIVLQCDHNTPERNTSRIVEDEYPDDVYDYYMFYSHADLLPAYLRDDCLKVRIELDTGTYRTDLIIVLHIIYLSCFQVFPLILYCHSVFGWIYSQLC